MIYLTGTVEEIADRIKNQKQSLIIYGAGMIGATIIPGYLEEMGLTGYVDCYVDADIRKQGGGITADRRCIPIYGPERLKDCCDDTVIIITNSNFMPIVAMLENMEKLRQTPAYIWPVILEQRAARETGKNDLKSRQGRELIPKKINYCWFSGKEMPDYLKRCVETWHRHCPDYEIVRWDEHNYDVNSNRYMRQAYESEKWGFVPDIARLDILYQYGGIYLDTDVELLKSLDELLCLPGFAGVEKWGNINLGGCSGCVAGHPVIKKILDFRINEPFVYPDGTLNTTTCGYYETKPLMELGFKPNNTVQQIQDFTVFSSDYFQPYDYMSGKVSLTQNTFSIHHFNGGWLDKEHMAEREETQKQYRRMTEGMRKIGER